MTIRVDIAAAGARQGFTIYTPFLENLNYFLGSNLTAADLGEPVDKQVSVKAHQRRQYPGDPSQINVAGATREFVVDPTRRSGNGLPGRSIVMIRGAGTEQEERRTFTLKGRWVDFHAWISTNAGAQLDIINSTGARYTIPNPD